MERGDVEFIPCSTTTTYTNFAVFGVGQPNPETPAAYPGNPGNPRNPNGPPASLFRQGSDLKRRRHRHSERRNEIYHTTPRTAKAGTNPPTLSFSFTPIPKISFLGLSFDISAPMFQCQSCQRQSLYRRVSAEDGRCLPNEYPLLWHQASSHDNQAFCG